jgi:glycosyltransferase involved in cell wall biosynthesis
MIYLFVHQNFPGQYRHIIRYLANQPGNQVYFITQPNENWMEGIVKLVYTPEIPFGINCHDYVRDFDRAVRVGLAVADVCLSLRDQGVVPDLIAGHSGWGETLFIKDVFPETPLLSYLEFFYHTSDTDVGFDPEFPSPVSDRFRLRGKNVTNLAAFEATDWGNTPTRWQHSLYPPEMRSRITVLHEGVDTKIAQPCATAWLQLAREGKILTRSDEVISYVARNLEPYRGFHIFMRAAREILSRRPKAHIVIVGGDKVSYGAQLPGGETYRARMLREVGSDLPMDRIHFLSQVPYEVYLNLLQVSSAHVYLTYPFVLSWSFIEAMACGCAVIGSDTPPVLEVLRDGENGLLVDFFSPERIADRVDQILDHPNRAEHLRQGARATAVERFDLDTVILPRWVKLFDSLIQRRRPDASSLGAG